MTKKVKLVRVVTQAEVVVWHLKNFINLSKEDFQVYILGDLVRGRLYLTEISFVVQKDILAVCGEDGGGGVHEGKHEGGLGGR